MHPLLEELVQLNDSLRQAREDFLEIKESDLDYGEKIEEIVAIMKISTYAGNRAIEIQKEIKKWSEEDLRLAQETRTLDG